MGSNYLRDIGFPFGVMKMHSIMTVLNDTKLFTLKGLILQYVNFTIIFLNYAQKERDPWNNTLYVDY